MPQLGGRVEEAVRDLCQGKQPQNVLDYDDLLLYWAEMAKEADFAEEIASRFAHILVDEYQDTNRLQAAFLLAKFPCSSAKTQGQ